MIAVAREITESTQRWQTEIAGRERERERERERADGV